MSDKRQEMISVIRDKYGLDSPRVLSVIAQIEREKFAPKKHRSKAYDDFPIDIGHGQTMSQPYTVAFMTHLLLSNKQGLRSKNLKKEVISNKVKKWRVLEIGTGSGYQAAVLSKLVSEVYSIEIVSELAQKAAKTLRSIGINNVQVKKGSGEFGWKEHAPYNAIIVTAGVEKIPTKLFDQLSLGGVLVAPVGKGMDKQMTRYKKPKAGKIKKEEFGIFHFVPFVEK